MREAIGVVGSELDIEVQQREKRVPGAGSLSRMETDQGRWGEELGGARALGSTAARQGTKQLPPARASSCATGTRGRRRGRRTVAVLTPASLSCSFPPRAPQCPSSRELEQGRCSLGAAGASGSQDPVSLPLSQISALGNWKHM